MSKSAPDVFVQAKSNAPDSKRSQKPFIKLNTWKNVPKGAFFLCRFSLFRFRRPRAGSFLLYNPLRQDKTHFSSGPFFTETALCPEPCGPVSAVPASVQRPGSVPDLPVLQLLIQRLIAVVAFLRNFSGIHRSAYRAAGLRDMNAVRKPALGLRELGIPVRKLLRRDLLFQLEARKPRRIHKPSPRQSRQQLDVTGRMTPSAELLRQLSGIHLRGADPVDQGRFADPRGARQKRRLPRDSLRQLRK